MSCKSPAKLEVPVPATVKLFSILTAKSLNSNLSFVESHFKIALGDNVPRSNCNVAFSVSAVALSLLMTKSASEVPTVLMALKVAFVA